MKNRLVIIGKNLYLNLPFMEYIERELGHLGFLEQIIKLPETSSGTVSLLQQQIQMGGNLVIVANKTAFTPISKLLATMIDDTLILKGNLLIPSKSDIYDDNSFLAQLDVSTFYFALAEPVHTLPMFLIEHREKEGVLQLFQMDEESTGVLLEPLAETYGIEISFTTLTPGWIQVECISK